MTGDDSSFLKPTDMLKRLKIVDVNKIEPHEQYIDKLLIKLKDKILNDGVFKDPILADYSRGLVIDGTHRLLAMRELGFKYIPVLDFDYLNDDIELGRWFRIVERNINRVFERIRSEINLREASVEDDNIQEIIDEKPVTILFKGRIFISEKGEWYQVLKDIDNELKNEEIDFIEDYRLENINFTNHLVIGYKRISRYEILRIFKSNIKLSYKSTRHTPPFRILNINIPLELLNNSSKAERYLSKLDLEYLGKEILYEDRIYRERIYVGRIRECDNI